MEILLISPWKNTVLLLRHNSNQQTQNKRKGGAFPSLHPKSKPVLGTFLFFCVREVNGIKIMYSRVWSFYCQHISLWLLLGRRTHDPASTVPTCSEMRWWLPQPGPGQKKWRVRNLNPWQLLCHLGASQPSVQEESSQLTEYRSAVVFSGQLWSFRSKSWSVPSCDWGLASAAAGLCCWNPSVRLSVCLWGWAPCSKSSTERLTVTLFWELASATCCAVTNSRVK